MNLPSSDRAMDAPRPYSPPAQYPSVVCSSRYIRLRDGTRLAIDLYLPAPLPDGVTIPTILLQTRYWRSAIWRPEVSRDPNDPLATANMRGYKRRFLAQGYAWVDADVRGTGASFGHRLAEFSEQEISDGGEIVAWIIQQPWSDGQVGSLGISYEGTTAELLLANSHPAVKAVAPMFSLFDAYTDVAFPGGIRSEWFLNTWSAINEALDRNEVPEGMRDKLIGVRPVDEDQDGSLLAAALADHSQNTPVMRQIEGIVFRDDAPASGVIDQIDSISPFTKLKRMANPGAAVYSISGWLDGAYPHSAIKRFLSLANPGSKLLLGPWNHGGDTNISPYSGGPASFDLPGELLKFFDYHLKGIDTGIAQEKPVHYFTMGPERWNAADDWPPQADFTAFYFGQDHQLLTTPPATADAADSYLVDVTAGTGERARWNSLVGMPLENPYPNRADQDARLLCYTSTPLAQDLEMTGHPLIELFVQANAAEADFFAYLEDVGPDGRVAYVTEGLLRAVHRALPAADLPYRSPAPYHSFCRADALPFQPGEMLHLVFDLLPTSFVFRQGHAIRVALAGADQDHFTPPASGATTWQVHRSSLYPSHIKLPLVNIPQAGL